MNNARVPLLSLRDYRLHLAGTSISAVGDGMQFIATSWLATTLTGKGYAAALVLIFHALPGILFAPFAGVLADRLERRQLAALSDTFRALVLLSIPVLHALGRLEVWHLYAMAFLDACGEALSRPARTRLVREILPAERLLEANTSQMTALQLGMILGAMSSGFIVAASSPVVVMVINAISFVLAAVLTVLIRKPSSVTPAASANSSILKSFTADFLAGMAYIRANPQLAFPYLVGLALSTTAQSMNAILVPFVRTTLGLDANALGLIDGSWAVGAVIAGFSLPILGRMFARERLMVLGPWCVSISLLLCASANGLVWAMLANLLTGAFTRTNVLYRTTAQERTQLDFQGRVEGAFGILTSLAFLLIYAAMGAAQEIVSPRVLILVQAAFVAIAGVWAWRELGLPSKLAPSSAD